MNPPVSYAWRSSRRTRSGRPCLFDADNDNNLYIKRFTFERAAQTRHLNFMGDNPACRFVALSSEAYPRFEVTYGAPDDSASR